MFDKPIIQEESDGFEEWVREELGPDLDLSDRDETLKKLEELERPLAESLEKYKELVVEEEPKGFYFEAEEAAEVTDSYVKSIEGLLPAGYRFVEMSMPQGALSWRGSNPVDLLSLMSDEQASIHLESNFPNVARKWSTSLSYGRSKKVNPKMPFVLAIGFTKPKNWEVKSHESNSVYKDSIERVEGDIEFDDVQCIAIRLKGKMKGQVFPPKFYKLQKKEKMAA